MTELSIFFGVFIATYFGVAMFRRWAVRHDVLDTPNDRSSHEIPTPRGGGLIIAVTVLSAYIAGSFFDLFEISWAFVASAAIIVFISWLDDLYSISVKYRIVVHLFAAVLFVVSTTVSSPAQISELLGLSFIEYCFIGLKIVWIIWLLNAYNFMDGIDGIAAFQSVSASFGYLLIGIIWHLPSSYFVGGIVMFASLAFLLHNWPPARIFMGDAGSAFLGFVFAAFPLTLIGTNGVDNWMLIILGLTFVWMFVFDSVVTFLRRLITGQKVSQAHREHLYQRLIISGYSHRTVTLIYGVTSLILVIFSVLIFASRTPAAEYLVILLTAISSFLLLIFCWKRGCLFGDKV